MSAQSDPGNLGTKLDNIEFYLRAIVVLLASTLLFMLLWFAVWLGRT